MRDATRRVCRCDYSSVLSSPPRCRARHVFAAYHYMRARGGGGAHLPLYFVVATMVAVFAFDAVFTPLPSYATPDVITLLLPCRLLRRHYFSPPPITLFRLMSFDEFHKAPPSPPLFTLRCFFLLIIAAITPPPARRHCRFDTADAALIRRRHALISLRILPPLLR